MLRYKGDGSIIRSGSARRPAGCTLRPPSHIWVVLDMAMMDRIKAPCQKVKRRTCCIPSTTLDRITDSSERQPAPAALGDGTWANDARRIPLFSNCSASRSSRQSSGRRCVVVCGIWMISKGKRLTQLEKSLRSSSNHKSSHKKPHGRKQILRGKYRSKSTSLVA